MTDGDRFGYEKPSLPDKTFYDPCCDCVKLAGGKRYLICDLAYIGAPVGVCMDQFKEVSPEIIR